MNLIDFARYKKLLTDLSLLEPRHAIEKLLQQYNTNLNTHNIDFKDLKSSMANRSENIIKELDGMYQDVAQFKLCLERALDIVEATHLTEKSEEI